MASYFLGKVLHLLFLEVFSGHNWILEEHLGELNNFSLMPSHVCMNEWMMHLYSAFIVYCHTPKALYNHVGGSLLNHHQCAASLGWCDGSHRTTAPVRSPHTSYRWRGERDRANQVEGIIRRHDRQGPVEGIWPRTPGLHPYSLREVSWDFLMTTESQDLGFNVSSERRCFLQYSVPVTILGH